MRMFFISHNVCAHNLASAAGVERLTTAGEQLGVGNDKREEEEESFFPPQYPPTHCVRAAFFKTYFMVAEALIND